MTVTIKIGDRVQWWEEFKNTKHEPRMMTGTVVSASSMYCGINGDVPPGASAKEKRLFGGTWVRPPNVLTRIEGDGKVLP